MESTPSIDDPALPEPVYLSSLESRRFADVFEAVPVRSVLFESGKPAVLANLTPAVNPEGLDIVDPLETVLLTARFEGDNILEWKLPLFVHIAVVDDAGIASVNAGQPLSSSNATSIAWGELYSTSEKAKNHELR